VVEGLIVAAGKSERTGHNYKMALKIGQRSVIEKAIASMIPYCSRVVVVTGYNASIIAELTNKFEKVELVHNPEYEKGMFSSVKIGLSQIKATKCLFLPGDYPFIAAAVYELLLAYDHEIIVPTYNKQPGHPILLRRSIINSILTTPCLSLRDFITGQEPNYIEVGCPGIHFDIDSMDDYEKALILNSDF